MMPADAAKPARDLFGEVARNLPLDEGAIVLGGFAQPIGRELLDTLAEVSRNAPFRHLVTPGGWPMSVAMTNCGTVGWVSDRSGYRYDPADPESGRRWPPMPAIFSDLAARAAAAAGFPAFRPDACLINRYTPGARLSLHQDRNERHFDDPIVSVSLGLPAVFLWGSEARGDRPRRVPVMHGDVVVWGGPARMTFHGVLPLEQGCHPLAGGARYNLTFRRAL